MTGQVVWVVMGNDYPDSVFTEERDAEDYCAKRTQENRDPKRPNDPPRIYWRTYSFVVNERVL